MFTGLGLRSLSICNRSVESRYKKVRINVFRGSPEDETLRKLRSISTRLFCREGDRIITRWLVVDAERSGSGSANFIFKGLISTELRFEFEENNLAVNTIFSSCLIQSL